MNLSIYSRSFALLCGTAALLVFAGSSQLLAKESPPAVSAEGLVLQKSKDAQVVYLKPGATFGQYNKVAIIDAYVEFSEDWQRDYNRDIRGVQGRVSTKDMDRMKAAMSAEFKKVFTEELQKNGGYEVVDANAPSAPGLLIVRPAIANLQVSAPDLMSADMRTTVVRSAGQMTIYLELWDSATDTLLARVMDAQEDDGMGRVANRVTNKAAADEILREWAGKLRKHLDTARANASGS